MNDGAPQVDETSSSGQRQEPAAPEDVSGWMFFNEQPVMLQLIEPCMGVNYPSYTPMVTSEGVTATQTLTGVLHVKPNGSGGFMLVLQVTLKNNDILLVAVHPDTIGFCTRVVERSKIVQP